MDKKLIMAINRLGIGETLGVKIKCVESNNCTGCIFRDDCSSDIDCNGDIKKKYFIEL